LGAGEWARLAVVSMRALLAPPSALGTRFRVRCIAAGGKRKQGSDFPGLAPTTHCQHGSLQTNRNPTRAACAGTIHSQLALRCHGEGTGRCQFAMAPARQKGAPMGKLPPSSAHRRMEPASVEALGPGDVEDLPPLTGAEDLDPFLTALEDPRLSVRGLLQGASRVRVAGLASGARGGTAASPAWLLPAAPVLYRAMGRWRSVGVVQVGALNALAPLACGAGEEELVAGLPDVWAAAEAHAGDVEVQVAVCGWVTGVVVGCRAASGALLACAPLVQRALEAHGGASSALSAAALSALRALGGDAANAVPLMAYLGLVPPALTAHSGVAGVVQAGLGLLRSLSVSTGSEVALMAYVGLVPPALAAHSGVAGVVQAGLAFLSNLCADAANVAPLAVHAELVPPALVAHGGVASVVEAGLAFLQGLSADATNAVPLMAYVDLAPPALAAHGGTVGVAKAGMGFLHNLSVIPANAVPLMAHVGLVPPVLAAHSDNAAVVRASLGFVFNVAFHPANRRVLQGDVALVAAVRRAAQRHRSDYNRAVVERLHPRSGCAVS
jgi:hypothetical protein